MILNNRKETYDIKLSRRRIQYTGRCAAQTGASAGGGARAESTGREVEKCRGRNKGRVLGASLQRSRCEAGPATGEKPKAAAHGSEARRKDPGPGNPGGGSSRIYPGIQARAGEAGGRQRAQQRYHPRAERGHQRPQIPAGDANQLRRRLINRALRGPSDGANRYRFLAGSPDPATSSKLQAPSSKRSSKASSPKQQASSDKPRATSSWIALPS